MMMFVMCLCVCVCLRGNGICIIRASITFMFVTNELVRSAIKNTPNIVRSSFRDIELFGENAHKEIAHHILDGMNIATDRIKYDLESTYETRN